MFAPCVTIKAYFPATESRDMFAPCVTIKAYFPATESRDICISTFDLRSRIAEVRSKWIAEVRSMPLLIGTTRSCPEENDDASHRTRAMLLFLFDRTMLPNYTASPALLICAQDCLRPLRSHHVTKLHRKTTVDLIINDL